MIKLFGNDPDHPITVELLDNKIWINDLDSRQTLNITKDDAIQMAYFILKELK